MEAYIRELKILIGRVVCFKEANGKIVKFQENLKLHRAISKFQPGFEFKCFCSHNV